MGLQEIENLRLQITNLRKSKNKVIHNFLIRHEQDFVMKYTHESTAIEGNTLTFAETMNILRGRRLESEGNSQRRREVHEVKNHYSAYQYIRECLNNEIDLDERLIKNIHKIVTNYIMEGGNYRTTPIAVSGSSYNYPRPENVRKLMNEFCSRLQDRNGICGLPESMHPVELAAWSHAEFVTIHPFPDGNGRTARLIMNYQLMRNGYLPISISQKDKAEYYTILERYHVTKDAQPFSQFISDFEQQELKSLVVHQHQLLKGFEIEP